MANWLNEAFFLFCSLALPQLLATQHGYCHILNIARISDVVPTTPVPLSANAIARCLFACGPTYMSMCGTAMLVTAVAPTDENSPRLSLLSRKSAGKQQFPLISAETAVARTLILTEDM